MTTIRSVLELIRVGLELCYWKTRSYYGARSTRRHARRIGLSDAEADRFVTAIGNLGLDYAHALRWAKA